MSKQIGKIVEFDGFSGILIDKSNNKHIFSNDDIVTKDLTKNDIVSFESELFKTIDNKIYIARFVKKIDKNDGGSK